MTTQCKRSISPGELAVVLVVGAVLCGLMTSCENSDDALNVFPGNATMGSNITAFTISVVSATREIALPLEWSVSNPELGSITSTSGYAAVYDRTASNGMNSITVFDQSGTKGTVSVNQIAQNTGQPGTSTNAAATSP